MLIGGTPSRKLCLLCSAVAALATCELRAADFDFFEQKIRPILVEQCYKCHSAKAEKLKGDLLLDSRQGVLKGGENGPVLVPGDPDKSRLIQAIRWTNKDLQMPPKHRLSDQQVADFVAWVKMGAADPRTGPANSTAPTVDYAAARRTWGFRPPLDPPVPDVQNRAWCKSPIDRFILARLEEKGIKPAAPADKRTLIRRAYFDLIGLPPSPQEVQHFVDDSSADAFAKVVDRLLASPHYGERWARHWLDLVRYTDSFDQRGVGGEGDCVYAWRYRDWVVKSLNADVPYDQFVRNQIAGDLLPPTPPAQFNSDGFIATAMYVIGNWPGGDADRKKMMTDIADDQVDVTSRAFLGVTLACARCHDHKFDPFTQHDYYAMAGIFLSTHFLPNPGSPASGVGMIRVPMGSPAEIELRNQYQAHVTEMQKQLDQFIDAQYTALARSQLSQTDKYLAAAWSFLLGTQKNASISAAQLASQEKLDPYLLERWVAYLKPMLSDVPQRKLLTRAIHNGGNIAGVVGWSGADGRPCPNVLVNNTDHPVTITTLTLPPKSLAMHPGPTSGVAVAWTSPISGTVRVRGRVLDADPNCGDGIAWSIEHCRGRSTEALAVGAFPNGGSQNYDAADSSGKLKSIDVKAGDILQLTVFPKGDYTCDTTVVELQISDTSRKQTWNLAGDVVGDLLVGDKGNPHADGFGNPGVWQFFEAGEQQAPASSTPGSTLAAWIDAAQRTDDPAHVSKISTQLRDSLAALDSSAIKSPAQSADAKLYQDLTSLTGPFWGEARKQLSHLSPDIQASFAKMSDALAELRKSAPAPLEEAQGLLEGGIPQSEYEGTHDTHILARGRYDRPGELVPRGLPRLLAGDDQPHISHGSGRLELADWVASPQNPMTAKVMVNRIWQHHFGEGIVRTPSNFGKLGIPPTHPELLEWLSHRFIDSGWSIKAMHRMIMLSAAYQQSSIPDEQTAKADPGNMLLGRMNRQRLEAEPIRDSLLAVSGTLDESMGGPAFRDLNVPRRTLYLMTIRSDRSNYRMLFDAADPTGIVDHRIDSTVAPQALFLLNDLFAMEKAKVLADRVLKQASGDDRARIQWLYQLLYGRAASDNEIQIGLDALKQTDANSSSPAEAAWMSYCQVLLCSNEFVYID